MPNPVQLIPAPQTEKTLNKEQKRFNNLVQKINDLQTKIALAKTQNIELWQIGEARIKPVEDKAKAAQREWLFKLHQHPAKAKLSKKLAEKFQRIMLEEIEALILEYTHQEDIELQQLYAYYEGSGRNYEEILAENEREEAEMATDLFNFMFGTDIDTEDLADPEKMQEKINSHQAFIEEAEQKRKNTQQKHKKNDKAQAAAEKRQAAEDAVKKTAKQIYLDLVRHFHPDKEPDEQLRAEKTEMMKQITAAYEADNHFRLLELQLTLLEERNNAIAGFDSAQLKYFNQTLQQQVLALEEELYMASPESNGNPYASVFSLSETQMQRKINAYIKSLKQDEKGIRHNLELIREEQIFMRFVREFEFMFSPGW